MVAVHPPPGTGAYGTQVQREAVRRSWVVVPTIDERAVAEAWRWGADVVVLDLEETVHESRKAQARGRVRDAIHEVAQGGAEVFIRPDIELLYADLEAALVSGLTGVVLPMVTSADQVREAAAIIDEFECKRALHGVFEIHLALETPQGNLAAMDLIAASPRVRSISLGRADLVMDLRGEPSGELHMVPYLLQRLVVVARAAGVEPIGAWWDAESRGTVASPEATLRAAARARRNGLRGGLCARSSQVAPLNQGFTPTAAEVERARGLVEAFEVAQARGHARGLWDGQLVDWARAEAARRVIADVDLCRQRDEKKQRAAAAAAHEG